MSEIDYSKKYSKTKIKKLDLLNLKLKPNDAKAETLGEYFQQLLTDLWILEDGFSGKRPFGNSGWKIVIEEAFHYNGIVIGTEDRYDDEDDDCIDINFTEEQIKEIDFLILAAIKLIS